MKVSESGLFEILTDGQFHSGQELANCMGVSRTAVWKHLASIRKKGVDMVAVRGRGYRLSAPVELLDTKKISGYLDATTAITLQDLDIHYQLDSTNRLLRDRLGNNSIHAHVVCAEYQTEGRGRGTNLWLTAPAAGLCLSLGWHFESAPKTLSALSLAAGVVLTECLAEIAPATVRLKWPNDLVYAGAKLGGVLIESRGQLAGAIDLIIGIGINIDMPPGLAANITQNVTDLTRVFGYRPSRNLLAAIIINRMFRLLGNYDRYGFESYIDKWRELDITRGSNAILHQAGGSVTGHVVDIDEYGFLIMSVDGTMSRFSSGDLSLRIINESIY